MVCSPAQAVSLVNHIVQLTSYPETIEEEGSEVGSPCEEDPVGQMDPSGKPSDGGLELPTGGGKEQPPHEGSVMTPAPKSEDKDAVEMQKRRRLEQAGIKVMPAAQRFARLAVQAEAWPGWLCACLGFGICLAWSFRLVSHFPLFPSQLSSLREQIEIAASLHLRACLCQELGCFQQRRGMSFLLLDETLS